MEKGTRCTSLAWILDSVLNSWVLKAWKWNVWVLSHRQRKWWHPKETAESQGCKNNRRRSREQQDYICPSHLYTSAPSSQCWWTSESRDWLHLSWPGSYWTWVMGRMASAPAVSWKHKAGKTGGTFMLQVSINLSGQTGRQTARQTVYLHKIKTGQQSDAVLGLLPPFQPLLGTRHDERPEVSPGTGRQWVVLYSRRNFDRTPGLVLFVSVLLAASLHLLLPWRGLDESMSKKRRVRYFMRLKSSFWS